MSFMLDHYTQACDPYHLGHTSVDQIGLAYVLTNGMVFPWSGGGVVLRRRRLYPTVGLWSYCGFARPGETTIKQMPGFAHAADMAYQYSGADVLGNGLASVFSEPVRVDFDGAGDLITPPLPMYPVSAVAKPLAGGKFLVTFEYNPHGQGGWPKDFQVFGGADAASVDYNTPLVDSVTGLSTVPFVGRRTRYTFTTAAFGDGTTKVFGARARNASAVAEKNTLTTRPRIARATSAAAGSIATLGMRMR